MELWKNRPAEAGYYWFREPGRPDIIARFDGEYLCFCGNNNVARPDEYNGQWLGPISPDFGFALVCQKLEKAAAEAEEAIKTLPPNNLERYHRIGIKRLLTQLIDQIKEWKV